MTEIKGWLKPLSKNMDFYAPSQTADKGVLHELDDRVIEGVHALDTARY